MNKRARKRDTVIMVSGACDVRFLRNAK